MSDNNQSKPRERARTAPETFSFNLSLKEKQEAKREAMATKVVRSAEAKAAIAVRKAEANARRAQERR